MKRTDFVLFNNYDVSAAYEDAKQFLFERDDIDGNITESDIWEEVAFNEQMYWNDVTEQLKNFMAGKKFIIVGTNGLWNGNVDIAVIIDNYDDLRKAWKDCDYINIYEANGHLYIQSSHHDGNNHYELRELTERGIGYLERWENGPESDKRTYDYIMGKLAEPPYSRNANYVEWENG